MRVLLLLILLLPQLAAARVYMCVDPVSGKKTFSDKGCQTSGAQEEVRIQAVNVTSGKRTAREKEAKTWVSERDTRRTGLDYSADQRRVAASGATASIGPATQSDGS